jgi:hypothetical protein
MPTTFYECLPERKASKRSGINWVPADEGPAAGTLAIFTDRSSCTYAVAEFPADEGRGFHLVKRTPGTDRNEEAYSCFLPQCGDRRDCECKGFAYAGHCKHLDALAALIENGWL